MAGFTFFEVGVAAVILSILGVVMMQRIAYYQAEAERVAVLSTVASLRTGLHMKVAQLRMTGQGADIAVLAGQNPIAWLGRPPPNYAGEYSKPGPHEVASGSWYFDRTTKTLVYLFTKSKTFREASTERVGFKVELIHLQAASTKFPVALESNQSVVLIQVDEAKFIAKSNN